VIDQLPSDFVAVEEPEMDQGAYGNRLGSRFQLNSAPVVILATLRRSQIAVTLIVNDNPNLGRTLPIPVEDAFLVHLMTRDCLAHDLYIDNKSVSPDPFPTGVTALYDLMRDPIEDLRCPTACLSFYLPHTALEEIADDVGERRIPALDFRHGRAYDDPVMRSLGQALLPALAKPEQVNTLFVDHIGLAFRAHIASAYGRMHVTRLKARGGLAPWQERRARDILSNNLGGELPLAQVARECGLSASHFTRAFRQSLGMAPHQWLLKVRVERAKEQLLNSDASLTDIAVDCGFADQSHFTRVFTKHVDASPGQWRRAFSSGPAAIAQESEIVVSGDRFRWGTAA
jgi:AraC-like DNA-binding protein